MAKIIFSWRHAIVESDLPSTTRHVLLTLSLHMNDVGESCFPSIERIAKETGLSRMSVITHLHKARDAGWIKIGNHGFRGQRWRANEYFCNFPAEEMNEKVVKEIDQADGKVVNLTKEGGQSDDAKVVKEVDTISTSNSTDNSTKEARPSDTQPDPPPPKSRTPKAVFNPALIDLPGWLDPDLWQDWCEDRKARRKPVTEKAAPLQIKKLAKYMEQGFLPQDVIENSIANGYQGLFPPNKDRGQNDGQHKSAYQQDVDERIARTFGDKRSDWAYD